MPKITRVPWPESGIDSYDRISDGRWGWLSQNDHGSFEFHLEDPPTEEEILERWGYRFVRGSDGGHTETTSD